MINYKLNNLIKIKIINILFLSAVTSVCKLELENCLITKFRDKIKETQSFDFIESNLIHLS